jgi:hypothetical protein
VTTTTTTTLLAISTRQPMAHAIVFLGKGIENRSNPGTFRRHRGPVAIHASGMTPSAEFTNYWLFIRRVTGVGLPYESLTYGAIIGLADLVDIVSESDSPWFVGPSGLVLVNPRPLPTPVPCKGQLGLWPVPAEARAAISAQGVMW